MKYHRLDGFNNRQFFQTVLEAEKAKIKMLTDLVLGEGPLPDFHVDGGHLAMCSYDLIVDHVHERREIKLSCVFSFSYNDITPMKRVPPSWAPPPNASYWSFGLQHMNFGGTQAFSS